MVKKILGKFDNLKLFHKLVFAFVFTIIIPGIIFYSIATHNIKKVTNRQVHNELIYSVDITQTWINDLFGRLSSAMIYAYESKNVRELLLVENNSRESDTYKYQRLSALNNIKATNLPIINDIVSNNVYLTLISLNEINSINYTYNTIVEEQLSDYINEKSYISRYILWQGFENSFFYESNIHVINLIKYVFDEHDKGIIGIIVLSIPEQSISQQLHTEKEGHFRLLLDKNMMIMAASDSNLIGKPLSSICDYQDSMFSSKDQVLTVKTNSNNTAMVYYKKIKSSDFIILEMRDTSLFLEDVLEGNRKVLGITFVFVMMFFIIALIIANGITMPLKKLSLIMKNTDYYLKEFEYAGDGTNEIHILEQSFSKMKKNMLRLIEENKQKEVSKREAELKALQAQISPHFLFNTLNSIRWTCVNNNSKKAADMVFALNNLLRISIDKEDALISLEEEITNLGYYIAIMKMRRSMTFDMVVEVPDKLLGYEIPRLLLQPLVENSIFHGFINKKLGGLIKIKAIEKDDCTIIKVEDNGIGISEEVNLNSDTNRKKSTGIGVSNVDERIKLQYGEKYGMKIDSIFGKGTIITIILPLKH